MKLRRHVGFAVLLASSFCVAQETLPMKLLLRTKNANTSFKLGEEIKLEYACAVEPGATVEGFCGTYAEAIPITPDAKVALDSPNPYLLFRALDQFSEYRPGSCGVTAAINIPVMASLPTPSWRDGTLNVHVPVASGRYRVQAFWSPVLDPSFFQRPILSSEPLEIEITDNPIWPDNLMHYDGCKTDMLLEVLPGGKTLSVLRSHLSDCAEINGDQLSRALSAIVSIELQTEFPEIYRRMWQLARMDPKDVNQAEAARIKSRLVPLYRAALLDTGNQLVRKARSEHGTPYEYSRGGFMNFDYLVKTWTPYGFMKQSEEKALLREAGWSRGEIKDLLKR